MFSKEYSSLLLVLMSIEKCFAVYFPLKSRTVCTVKTAKWSTGIVGVILTGFNLQWFIFVEAQATQWVGYYFCGTTKYFNEAFDLIGSVLYSFGPFALMFVTNFAIAFKFMAAKF